MSQQSGILVSNEKIIVQEAELERIWEKNCYRLFLSHKTEDKVATAELKKNIKKFGISCFVAHEDIEPTREWQNEIENALFSMDAFVALMTKDFHNSYWTDQEVGIAIGRAVPIISVKLGCDPYGFIGKYQALKCEWKDAPFEIAKLLIKQEKMKNSYIQAINECASFEDANNLAKLLEHVDSFSDEQANSIIDAYKTNSQINSGYGFNGKKPHQFGEGLIHHLKRLTGKDYSSKT